MSGRRGGARGFFGYDTDGVPGYRQADGPTLVDLDGQQAPLSEEMQTPGHGLPERPDAGMANLQPFSRLTRGQALGKKSILAYNAATVTGQGSMTTILSIGGQEGSDLDACQMQITLSQPRVVKQAFAGIGDFNQQNLSGSYDNTGIGTANFPGTAAPIAWPPITAIIEWGLGGTSHVAYVDFVQGATINVTASWVRVHAAVAPDAQYAAGSSGYYELAANVGPGWPKPGIAQRTVFMPAIAPSAESGVFATPPFAHAAIVLSRDPEAVGTGIPELTAAYLRFWQGPTGVAVGGNVGNYYQSGNQPIDFPVPNAGAYFSVQSQLAASTKFAVCFQLAI